MTSLLTSLLQRVSSQRLAAASKTLCLPSTTPHPPHSNASRLFSGIAICSSAALKEKTLIIIKPDGVRRGLISDIIRRFERKGYTLIAAKFLVPSTELVERHYSALTDKPFFPRHVQYMTSSPVLAMVWQGENVVEASRRIIGCTDPAASLPGTIRGDFAMSVSHNVIHGSESVQDANNEISNWFSNTEVFEWERI